MTSSNLIGWLAASLMLAAFACKEPRALRLFAIAANALFIVYGLHAGVLPVAMLHLLLLPLNVLRLLAIVRDHTKLDFTHYCRVAKRTVRRSARIIPICACLGVPLAACNIGQEGDIAPSVTRVESMRPIQPFDEQFVVTPPP